MTKLAAAELLYRVVTDRHGPDDSPAKQIEAAKVLLDAVEKMAWVNTDYNLPEGHEDDPVIVVNRGTFYNTVDVSEIGWVCRHPDSFPYWMPAPELPEIMKGYNK